MAALCICGLVADVAATPVWAYLKQYEFPGVRQCARMQCL